MTVNGATIAGQGSKGSRAAVDTSSIMEGAMTGCTARSDIFQHRLLEDPPPVKSYQPGTWGPNAIHQLIAPNAWRLPFERAWREKK